MATVVHLSGADGMLEAAARIREAAGDGEFVLVAPEGAPVMANPLFLRALRELRPERSFVLVTPDQRARAMASGCRVTAYESLRAYEQKSLDATEELERTRLAAVAEIGREREIQQARRRRFVVAAAAGLALLLVVVPSADVIVAADVRSLGPVDLDAKTVPGGTIAATRLSSQVSTRIDRTATGSRTERSRATGVERFTNRSLDRIEIGAGTIVATRSNIQFRTTETKVLPASSIFPDFFVSRVDIPIEAVEPGPSGNVRQGDISRSADSRISVSNEQPTSGGDEKHITFVLQADYDAASTLLDQQLDSEARNQLARFVATSGYRVEQAYLKRVLSRTPSGEVVGKEIDRFTLSATAEVIAFAVDEREPRASVLRRLSGGLARGHEVVPDSENVEIPAIEVTSEGVVWRIRARATQRPKVDEAALRLALIGQDRAAAAPLLAERGLRVLDVQSFPSWWPRLPLFPLRIAIRSGTLASLGGP